MQAIVQDKYGSAEVLHLKEIERPAIGDHDVLVRVRAAGVNPADWALMNGFPYIARPAPLYGLLKPTNPVRGTDVAGQVEAVGSGVTRFQPGDEVFGSSDRFVCRVRGCRRRHAGDQAVQPDLRPGGHGADGRDRRAAGDSRSRQGRARTAGADQRRLGRHRHLRGPDREGSGCGGHRRGQHPERRPAPIDRRRPRHRLHDGGLHPQRRAVRLHPRQRLEPLADRAAARADAERDAHPERRATSAIAGSPARGA